MIPKKPAPDLIRGGNRFSEKITLKQKPTKKPRIAAGLFDSCFVSLQCARIASRSSATMFVILIIGLTAGPAVSL